MYIYIYIYIHISLIIIIIIIIIMIMTTQSGLVELRQPTHIVFCYWFGYLLFDCGCCVVAYHMLFRCCLLAVDSPAKRRGQGSRPARLFRDKYTYIHICVYIYIYIYIHIYIYIYM